MWLLKVDDVVLPHYHLINSRQEQVRPQLRISFLLFLVLLLNRVQSSYGGNCWIKNDDARIDGRWTTEKYGRCSTLVQTGATKEECCSKGPFSNSLDVAFSEGEKLNPSEVFRVMVVGGIPCKRCKETCEDVTCPENQKCVMRGDNPKCVCSPNCSALRFKNGLLKQHVRGPVCGQDGRTYRSICRLLKRACRKKITLPISYYGTCKLSCRMLNCSSTKSHVTCLMDQNMIPHCVNCSQRKCSRSAGKNSLKSVCGVDGLTYPSICHLRQAACLKGKAIQIAYKGICKKRASCSTVKCSEGQTCLMESTSERPRSNVRCVTCSRQKWCRRAERSQITGPVCANNGKTYRSWCEMTQDACNTGIALDTEKFGSCTNSTPPTNYTLLT